MFVFDFDFLLVYEYGNSSPHLKSINEQSLLYLFTRLNSYFVIQGEEE